MDFNLNQLASLVEGMVDDIVSHDPEAIEKHVAELKAEHYDLNERQIADKIVQGESILGGILGAATGFGGLVVLPAAIPVDLVKYLRVQAYMICCLAHLYGYSLQDREARKTDLFLLMSHSSFDKIKEFVCSEASKQVGDDFYKKQAFNQLERRSSYKSTGTKAALKQIAQHVPGLVIKIGEKQMIKHTLRGVPKIFRGVLWRLGGRRIAEKTLQKSVGKVIPVLGAVFGGGIDWWLIRATGKVATDYYEKGGPDFLDAAYSLLQE